MFGDHTLTHWGRMTHISVSKVTIIGSDNGLSPDRRQAIIWTNAGILLIGPLGTNFSEILFEIYTFSFKKMHLKMSSGKWRPSCLGVNVFKVTTTSHSDQWIKQCNKMYIPDESTSPKPDHTALIIAVTPYECHCISNHRQLECLLKRFCKQVVMLQLVLNYML